MRLYYHYFQLRQEQILAAQAAINELKGIFANRELGLTIETRELPKELRETVDSFLLNPELDATGRMHKLWGWRCDRNGVDDCVSGDLLLLCCDPESQFVRSNIKDYPASLYGCALPDMDICAVYYFEDPYTFWHEVFHMFGADDCYKIDEHGRVTDPGPTCGQPNCIMQYGITSSEVGNWPFLCDNNIKRIREKAA